MFCVGMPLSTLCIGFGTQSVPCCIPLLRVGTINKKMPLNERHFYWHNKQLFTQIKPNQIHHLRPGLDEIVDELRLRVGTGVHLGQGAQLRIRAEHQIHSSRRSPWRPGLAVTAFKLIGIP